jgi:protein-S-isoprenylcysteine O-methyltransferase Ste14
MIVYLFIILFALHAVVAVQMLMLALHEPDNKAAWFCSGAFAVYALLFLLYTVVPQEQLRKYVVVLVGLYVFLVPTLAGLIYHMMKRVFHDEN